ncbi:MAG: DNA gyrase inhibitor YacG [Pseudomonadota bacterium]|nr:DNA gyrase inhibitor YacG [Pseudomonadota bacterium]
MTDSRCPQCYKPTVEGFRPFCSKRCADLDLGSWLNGAYRIETEEEVEIEEFELLSPHIEKF